MAGDIPVSIISELEGQALADPQLPRPHPTTSFWQLPPHATLSEVQSDRLAETTDYAIIGSGITGCSVASTLFEHSSSSSSPSFSVTVFEARTLTSGATGRNGGLLTSPVPYEFKALSEVFGLDEATKIARYANRTLEKMFALASSSEELKEVSEVRRTLDVVGFMDEAPLRESIESWRFYEEHVPDDRGKFQVLTPEEAESVSHNSLYNL